MENSILDKIGKNVLIGLFCIIVILSSIFMFILMHEVGHMVYLEETYGFCIGNCGDTISYVYGSGHYPNDFNQELVVNLFAGIIVIIFNLILLGVIHGRLRFK